MADRGETVAAETMEARLSGAKTKRELDLLVDYLRRPGRYEGDVREKLERHAEREAQRFSVSGEYVRAGRYLTGFRSVIREKS